MKLRQSSSEKLYEFVRRIDRTFEDKYGRGKRGEFNFESFRRDVKAKCLMYGVTDEIYSRIRPILTHDNDHLTWDELVEEVQDAEWLSTLGIRQFGTRTRSHNDGNFTVDDDGYVIVYTDGSCIRNGQPDAQAGIGVWFGDHHKLNMSEPLNRGDPVTNNVAEIRAVIEAIKIIKKYGVQRVAIYTDSNYLIDSITKWMFKWLQNEWLKSDGEPVIHKKQYRRLLMEMEDMDIKWVHVKSHNNDKGNMEADYLARRGAQKYGNLSDED